LVKIPSEDVSGGVVSEGDMLVTCSSGCVVLGAVVPRCCEVLTLGMVVVTVGPENGKNQAVKLYSVPRNHALTIGCAPFSEIGHSSNYK
jgi:hypothetical protein